MDSKQIYDSSWRHWYGMKVFGPMSRHARRLVFQMGRDCSFGRVLDVGCGAGVFLREVLARHPGASVTGIDVSSTAIEMARSVVPAGSFSELDIAVAPPAGGTYDLITLIDVAEHIADDAAAFRNLRTVCAGHMIIATLEGRMRDFEVEVGHVRNYQPGELTAKLERAGFSVIEYRHWGWPFYSPLYRDMSKSIGAHRKELNWCHRLMSVAVYWALACNVPGKGDFVIVKARPRP